jgi:SpoVK/Ycf46/Vps4 family AAA+-type ATPase
MSSETFNALDALISQLCLERQLWDLRREWQKTKERLQQWEEKEREIIELRELFENIDQNAQKLMEPPFQYAVYLGRSPGQEKDLVVGLGVARLEVRAQEEIFKKIDDLALGQHVLLNDKQNVVAIRDEYVTGETAEVVNIIASQGEAKVVRSIEGTDPLQLVVLWRDDEEITVVCGRKLQLAQKSILPGDFVQVDLEGKLALPRTKPRLHVKANGNEGTIVEISDRLHQQEVRIGDIVRIEPGLKFAFEKLPAYETGGLTLEEVPDVTYEDIGGLDTQIDEIYDAIELPYLHREAFDRYQLGRPKGILLYGPPGCGKTMVAKAVANSLTYNIRRHLEQLEQSILLYQELQSNPNDLQIQEKIRNILPAAKVNEISMTLLVQLAQHLKQFNIDANHLEKKLEEIRSVLTKKDGIRSFFLNVKGPELLDKYVGETEHRIRKIFEIARSYATYYTPVIIFFDEMEAMFRTRGSGRSSDVETTIVPQFLAELDGVESTADLIIIGASNRQDMIDPAILRPKRLDVKIKVDRPDRKSAEDIFARYLLPTLPLSSQQIPLPAALAQPGACVFRTAYPEYYPVEAAHHKKSLAQGKTDFHGLLPSGCDFRLALSFSPEQLAMLTALPHKTSIQDVLLFEEHQNLPWDKLRRFRSSLEISSLVDCLSRLHQRMNEETALHERVNFLLRQEWLAEAIVLHAIDLLYSSSNMVYVLGSRGTNYGMLLKDFMSGAIIANIVDRAKKFAIKRMLLDPTSDLSGIGLQDIDNAIEQEFGENKEQLALHKLQIELSRRDEEILSVQLFLETQERDPWSEEKFPLYKTNFATIELR